VLLYYTEPTTPHNRKEVFFVMNYSYPKNLYVDVRIEHVFSTTVRYTMRNLEECREKKYSAAFVRLFDGEMWYYASTSDLNGIQGEIDTLAKLAKPNLKLEENAVYKNLNAHKDEVMSFVGKEATSVSLDEKIEFLQKIMPQIEANQYVKLWRLVYVDNYVIKEFYNSKGSALKFDSQTMGFASMFSMMQDDKKMNGSYQKSVSSFDDIGNYKEKLQERIDLCENFLLNSVPATPGKYTVVLAPVVTGIFAHECFGHKSESDFMIGDEATRKEWQIGKKVGPDNLTISESGNIMGSGFVPYDDEGNKATMTHLIKNGVLSGRLHNSVSAADLNEPVTGNGRALNFECEPLVRMTTTYIDKGTSTYDELIAGVEDGYLITELGHGSGMSTFTLAPTFAYSIKNGKVDKPVRISVVTGNVFEALNDIDGLSDKLEMFSFVVGGCGKMAQGGMAVGFGGPYIRVKNMQVQ
jgi:TldD protein